MRSLIDRGCGTAAGWRASTHSTADPRACVEAASGHLIDGEFSLPAAPGLGALRKAWPPVGHATRPTSPPPGTGSESASDSDATVRPGDMVARPVPDAVPADADTDDVTAPGDGAVELGWATVGPLETTIRRIPYRRFEAYRYRRADDETVSRILVRIGWENPDILPEEELTAFENRVRDDVHSVWNVGARLENGDLLRVDVEFVRWPGAGRQRRIAATSRSGRAAGPVTKRGAEPGETSDAARVHQYVRIETEADRSSSGVWWAQDPNVGVWAHEVGHHLGEPDEYREMDEGTRPVYADGSLMSSLAVDDRARPRVDRDAEAAAGGTGRLYLPPRLLRGLSAAIRAALPTGNEETPGAVHALPGRATFSLDTRRAALHGGRGGGGHLPPGPMSDRPAVEMLGEVNPNGTFRAQVPGEAARVADGSGAHRWSASAGELFAGPARARAALPRGRMMFPEYWTEDDVVYAAEQAYLHARRHAGIMPDLERGGVYTWVGEYGGVRIEGEVRHGEFTAFRPADDQGGLTPPRYLPMPPQDPHAGPRFADRAVDIARIGDVRSRTGVYQAPFDDVPYGLHIQHGRDHDNGTYTALVMFLDPDVRNGTDPGLMWLTSRYQSHVDNKRHTMFPQKWNTSEMRDAVNAAHASAAALGAVGERRQDGSYRWVGEARGIRIEGIVRGGYHVAFRPTFEQPHLRWPKESPVAFLPPVTESIGRGTMSHPIEVQRLLFASGQLGIRLTVKIAVIAVDGVADEVVARYAEAVRTAAMELYGKLPRPDGAPLVTLSVEIVDEASAHHRITVAGEPDGERVRINLSALLGLPPDAKELLATVHQDSGSPVGMLPWQGITASRLRRMLRNSSPVYLLETSNLEESARHRPQVASLETRALALLKPEVTDVLSPGVMDAFRAGAQRNDYPDGWHWAEALYTAFRAKTDEATAESERSPGQEPGTEFLRTTVYNGYRVELALANDKINRLSISPPAAVVGNHPTSAQSVARGRASEQPVISDRFMSTSTNLTPIFSLSNAGQVEGSVADRESRTNTVAGSDGIIWIYTSFSEQEFCVNVAAVWLK